MSRIYVLTKVGRRAYNDGSVSEEEFRVLEYLKGNKSASDDQLEIVGGEGGLLRGMKRGGLITELTT